MYITVYLMVILVSISLESCPEDFCPSLWDKDTTTQTSQMDLVMLTEDNDNECICKEHPGKVSFCVGLGRCRVFPKHINITTKNFILKSTDVTGLKPGDLHKMTHLETLKIEENPYFTQVVPDSFLNMTSLKILSISSNSNLKKLSNGSFNGLQNLEELILNKNGFTSLSDVIPALATLKMLSKLKLNENSFPIIGNIDFLPLQNSHIKELYLILCQIDDIESRAFIPLQHLKALRIGRNNLNITNFVKVIKQTTTLELLNVYSIGLKRSFSKELLEAIAISNISSLCLARNQFEVITPDTFPYLPNIKKLDLRDMSIIKIIDGAFANLPNLKTLLLSDNKLGSAPTGVLLQQLTYLDLQKNSGDLHSTSSFSTYGKKFVAMKRLEQLNLSFNNIYVIFNSSFEGLTNLKILGIKNAKLYRIFPRSFDMLTNLVFLTLENNPFLKDHLEVIENGLFNKLENLQVLLLGDCGIDYLSETLFINLKNLEHLGLEKNKLLVLPNFEFLAALKSIDISENLLQPWHHTVFNRNTYLQEVSAASNKFTLLTTEMVEDFQGLIKLELMNNPFTCDCSFSWNNTKILNLITNQSVFCAFPDTTTSLTINTFLENSSCQHLSLIISVVVLLLFLIGTFVTMYYFRWHLRYWLFLTRLHLSRNHKIRKSHIEGCTNFIYDAFVSYSSDDRNFVIRLVTMLENYPPFIKMCVYERDFEAGTVISENVLESVAKSRKTVLIISNSYAKSQWCRWESQIAEHHRLFFHNENGDYVDDSLILIKLGPVNEAHMTPTLRYLLKTRVYLQWDADERKQQIFWDKLREALVPPKAASDNIYL